MRHFGRILIPICVATLLAFSAGNARAEGWAVGAADRTPESDARFAGVAAVRAGWSPGLVPPFRSGARDRFSAGIEASAWVAGGVRLGVDWEWLVDDTSAMAPVSGPGDIHLSTAACLVERGDWSGGLGWEVKLPNASNETELGTDETDVTLGAWGRWGRGPWSAAMAAGLSVMGNPLRFANQDDVPLVRLEAAWQRGPLGVRALSKADLPTARNPARVHAGGAIRVGHRWFAELEGGAGLTPAAADAHVFLRLGVVGALPVGARRD